MMANFISSFSIINAAALVGLISLLVPLIIHLINRSKGKLVYLGNIELVKQVKRIRVTEVKLSQWILLLLRILIFTLITLLVAGLNQKSNTQKIDETQLYFSPQWILTQEKSSFKGIQEQHPEAKSFVLTNDYPEISNDNFEQIKQKLSFHELNLQSSAFLTEIANRQPQANKIKIFSTNASTEFSVLQPQTIKEIEWVFAPSVIKPNSLSEILVEIYSDRSRALETRLLQIVFDNLNSKGNMKFKVNYHTTNQTTDLLVDGNNQGWIIWLSDSAVPEVIWKQVKQGKYLLSDYASVNKEKHIQSRTMTNAKVAGIDSEFVGLHQHESTDDLTHSVIWSDNSHAEILTIETIGSGLHYQFKSRFNPDWNNLVENPKFPRVFSALLSTPFKHTDSKRLAISELTSLPLSPTEKQISRDLHRWLILIIALLWLLERWLSEKRKANR